MKIVIDLQGAQTESRFRGIGRYSISLVQAIVKNKAEHEIILALNGTFVDTIEPIRAAFDDLLPQENIRVWYSPQAVKECESANQTRREVAELIREDFLKSLEPDIILVTSLFEGFLDDAVVSIKSLDTKTKVALILYDLILYIYPENYLISQKQKEYYYRKIEALKKADLLLGISQSSCKEAIELLEFPQKDVVNISAAVDPMFKPTILSQQKQHTIKAKYRINRDIVMYAPGGFDYRKNFENLIAAYGQLSQNIKDAYQLVIVSKVNDENKENLTDLAQSYEINDLVITGYVSDEELISFYSIASLFVFPSKHEGFGLPLLEAMSCGAAVIGSNTTSIPEVIGLEEALFDSESIDSISKKIEQALQDDSFREKIRTHATLQSQKFSWDASAKKALQAIETLNPNKEKNYNRNDLYSKISTLIQEDEDDQEANFLHTAKSLDLNTISEDKPSLFIDITMLKGQDFTTGIQRVVKSVLSEIYKDIPAAYNIVLIYLNQEDGVWLYRRASEYENNFLKNNKTELKNYVIEPKQKDIFLGLDLVSHVEDARKDGLYLQWRNRGVKIVFVVYDILPIAHPQWWPEGGHTTHTNWLNTIVSIADELISISQAVSNEVQQWVASNKIQRDRELRYSSFKLGADVKTNVPSLGLPDDAHSVLQKMKMRPTFLLVGTIEPRKGHKQALLAIEELWQQEIDINVVIVGKNGWMMEDFIEKVAQHSELNHRLFWLEGISDEYLEKVYQYASCLIASSEGEGFGLPLIEAAQHKLAVIARDIPVFREVAGEFAYYFPNTNESSILAKKIQAWLSLYENDTYPKSENMSWFTWKESTQELLSKIGL